MGSPSTGKLDRDQLRQPGEEAFVMSCRWESWDGTLALLSVEERAELARVLGRDPWGVGYRELRAVADQLVNRYLALAWEESGAGS